MEQQEAGEGTDNLAIVNAEREQAKEKNQWLPDKLEPLRVWRNGKWDVTIRAGGGQK